MTTPTDAPLLDLMRPPVPPVWRAGAPLGGNLFKDHGGPQHGDLQWLANDYADHRKGGRWFSYDLRDRIWVCIDPHEAHAINAHRDVAPPVTGEGYSCRPARRTATAAT